MSLTKVSIDMQTGTAPLPTATAGAIGEFKVINGSSGGALALPTGGTWAWFGFYKADVGDTVSSVSGGVGDGEDEIFAAYVGNTRFAMVWRVA